MEVVCIYFRAKSRSTIKFDSMPELPEVETIVRHLRKEILGKRIVDFTSDTPRIFRDHKPRTFSRQANSGVKRSREKVRGNNFSEVRKQVLGRKIESLGRIGKNILFNLSGGVCLNIHLMMTGKLLLGPREKQKHDRFNIKLSGGRHLIFNDIRKFGRCRIIDDEKMFGGEDALSVDFETFKNLIKFGKKILKNFLLDQNAISGVGNIYADEILWFAGIHPLRVTGSLKEREVKNLYLAMRKVLAFAIKKGGTSSRDYRKPDGSKGGYYEIRKVYQRTGKPCSRDSVKTQRIVVGGRGTHFCPKHQK